MRARWIALLTVGLLAFEAPAQEHCRAIDGDTVRCGAERIRLRDVYAVERNDAGGAEAKARLQRQLDSGQIRIDRQGKDKYGRSLGHVYVNGRRITQSDIGPQGGRGLGSSGSRQTTPRSTTPSAPRPPKIQNYSSPPPRSAVPRAPRNTYSAPRNYSGGKSYSGSRNAGGSRSYGGSGSRR